MKEKKGKKLIAGLASTLIFFGKNVYATSSSTSSSSGGKIGLLIGIILVIAVLTLGYKMDKSSDSGSKEEKQPKSKKEKKTKDDSSKDNTIQEDNYVVDAENDIPYESEKDEKYEPEKVEANDLNEDIEYEEDSVFSDINNEKPETVEEHKDFDATMVFNTNNLKQNEITSEPEEELENEDYEIGDLNEKIDELDDLDDIDDNLVNEKMLELERNNDEVENPEEFLNSLKKYEENVDDFAGFSTAEDKSSGEEVSSFSFGNSNLENDSKEHKKYTRKKDKVGENTLAEVEETKEELVEEETTSLDTGFLNQMEQNLMKNQEERLKSTKEKKTHKGKK